MGNLKAIVRKIIPLTGYYTKPDFLIVGAQKAGTSALHQLLCDHSMIQSPKAKEVHFFNDDCWYSSQRYYQYHARFPLPYNTSREKLLFEATPSYLYHPDVARRLYQYNKDLLIIVLLRNPIHRAFSAWKMYHFYFKDHELNHLYDPRSFNEAIKDEFENLENDNYGVNKRGYIKRGVYVEQLQNYLEYFDRKNMLMVDSSALKRNTDHTLEKVFQFLNVPHEFIPPKEVFEGKEGITTDYSDAFNLLADFYEPYNKKLYKLLGYSFDWRM